jgi:putative multiple sugar transport system substrate-binding protein
MEKSVRRLIATVAGTALALSLAACGGGGSGGGDDKGTVGVAMPTKSSERWIADGNNIKKQLEAAGYEVDLQYAEDDIPTQVSQVENMVTKGDKILVVAAIDGTALGDVLQTAQDSDIKVISYDRLIRETEAVDYYTTFDNEKVGVLQAQSLVDGLKAKGEGPYNVELFAGSPDDNNATFFWNGAMTVLQPMIDSGDLKVVSGQTKFDQAAILRWDPATAQKRMEDILTKSYTQETVDGVLSPYDGLSLGIIAALKSNGYGGGGKPLPVVTGQDAEVQSVKSIMAGEQYSTIFKDTRDLAKVTVDMIKAIGAGEKPEVNDTETYDNGVKVVPSYLLDPVPVTKDDVQTALVDTGYYTADEIK